jgi:hypothetical protein
MTTIKILPCQLTDTFIAAEIASLGLGVGDIVEAPNHISRAYGMAKYRLVKFTDSAIAGSSANKKFAIAATSGVWDVTIDVAGGAARAKFQPIGFNLGVVATTYPYCFVQISGIAAYTAGGTITDGDFLKPDETENGDLDVATAGTHQNIVGQALGSVDDNGTGVLVITPNPVGIPQ